MTPMPRPTTRPRLRKTLIASATVLLLASCDRPSGETQGSTLTSASGPANTSSADDPTQTPVEGPQDPATADPVETATGEPEQCPPIPLPPAWDHKRPQGCTTSDDFSAGSLHAPRGSALATCLALHGWCASRSDTTLPWRVRRALGRLAPLVSCRSHAGSLGRPSFGSLPGIDRLPDPALRDLHRTCVGVENASAAPVRRAKEAAVTRFERLGAEQATETLLRAIHERVGGNEYDYIRDVYEAPADVRARAGAVALLVKAGAMRPEGECSMLTTEPMAQASQEVDCGVLCSGEPFSQEPRAAGDPCTAFFLDRKHVVTAGHCASKLTEASVCRTSAGADFELPEHPILEHASLVRGFARSSADSEDVEIERPIIPGSALEVIGCEHIKGNNGAAERGNDWALLRINNDFALPESFVGLELADTESTPPSGMVHMLSHFAALTLKYSLPGAVDAVHDAYFEMQVDGYWSSSGAPVFDEKGHVVGIFTAARTFNYSNCPTPPPGEAGCCCMGFCSEDCDAVPTAASIRALRELYASQH